MKIDRVTIQSGLDQTETERLRLDYEQYTKESARNTPNAHISPTFLTAIFVFGAIIAAVSEWMGYK